MAISRTLTKTFKTITRSKSSPFLRKHSDDDDDAAITPLQPSVPPPKQLRLDIDFADTLNLDFHQLDFSDDSKLQAWTEKNTPKLPMDENVWMEPERPESRDRKSVLAPESVSNGFFESPLSTPTLVSDEWASISKPHQGQLQSRDFAARGLDNSRPTMTQSKSCSALPKRSKSAHYVSPKPTHASQFVKSRVASEGHVNVEHVGKHHVPPSHIDRNVMNTNKSLPPLNTSQANYNQNKPIHVAKNTQRAPHVTQVPQVTSNPVSLAHSVRHAANPSVDSFVTCTDKSPQLGMSRDHTRNMSIASVDTVSGYMDPALASTISRYYHLEGVDEEKPRDVQSREKRVSKRLSQRRVSRDQSHVASHASSHDSSSSDVSPFNTPSLDDRNSSSTFTMSPSTSTTMSTPSLVDSPSSCASVNVSYEKTVQPLSHSQVSQAPTPQVTPSRPYTLYSTDNDLVPPPRSKYRSRHYRFDSNASSVYSNTFVKEDCLGALRHSLYGSREGDNSPNIRPVSVFDIPQLSAMDYASAIKEGEWF